MVRALSRLMLITACLLVLPTLADVETALAQSSLPPCPTDQNQRYYNCFGTYTHPDGDKYVGEFTDDKPNGQGVYTFASNDEYSGEFSWGSLFGVANVKYSNGDIYRGNYVFNKRQGAGTYIWADRSRYVGKWKDGFPTEDGIHTTSDGEVLIGVIYRTNAIYDPTKDQFLRSPDLLTYYGGTVEKQQVAQSRLPHCPTDKTKIYHECFGTYTSVTGGTYVGEWKHDSKNGQGTYTARSGDKYVGEWKDNLLNGQITITYSRGDSFSGRYQSDKRDGLGTYTWTDGARFVGQWEDGLPTGNGIHTLLDGSTIIGAQYSLSEVYTSGYMDAPDVLNYSGGTVQKKVAQTPEQPQQQSVASNDSGRRLALVVGIDNYQHVDRLKKAVNDSNAVSDTLQTIGYEVLLVQDADRRTMSQKLQQFQSTIQSGDTAFFFFAGHGVSIGADNILFAADVPKLEPGQDDIAKDEGFSVDNIVRRIQNQGAKTAMLVLDACRNNPFQTDGLRSIGNSRGLTKQEAPEGVFVLFSAGLGQGALDRLSDTDPDPNSVFTRKLVPALLTPKISHVDLAKQVQSDVAELAATINVKQQPAYYDQIMGKVLMNDLQ